MLYIHFYHVIASAAGTAQDGATDAKDCDGVNGHSVFGSTKSWSDSLRDDEDNRNASDTIEPADSRGTDTKGKNTQQAGNGKQAARRALVFVAEDVTATRYLDTYSYV